MSASAGGHLGERIPWAIAVNQSALDSTREVMNALLVEFDTSATGMETGTITVTR
jgi:hypothetical protein